MMRDLGLSVPGHDEAMAEGFSHAEEWPSRAVGDGRDGFGRRSGAGGSCWPTCPRPTSAELRARGGQSRRTAKRAVGGGVQPPQAHQPGRGRRRRRRGAGEEQHHASGSHGLGQDAACADAARTLRVPFAIADATTLTEAGYVGEDVENILKLMTAADFDIPRAEIGIIHIDEIDKVARKAENRPSRATSGEGVQQALKIVEHGGERAAAGRAQASAAGARHDTIDTNILFILGGAFVAWPTSSPIVRGQEGPGLQRRAAREQARRGRALARVLPRI